MGISINKAAIGTKAQWADLCSHIRRFNPDYVVLVARKMPRLFEAWQLNLGSAICISDQALPFIYSELKNARVAIVDDLWNVGSTMLYAKERVERAKPREIKLFALGAKDAESALAKNVCMAEITSLGEARYKHLVNIVPDILRNIPKPYDADFPIVRCALRIPFSTWEQCWAWLQLTFGKTAVHTSVDEMLTQHFPERATVNLRNEHGWVLKVRLYFDFEASYCNVVPMALAPSLPLKDVYLEGSLAKDIFTALSSTLGELFPEDRRDALGRLGTFCDSLVFLDDMLAKLSGLLDRDFEEPFLIKDFAMQFGPVAEQKVRDVFAAHKEATEKAKSEPANDKERFLKARKMPEQQSLVQDQNVIGEAINKASYGCRIIFDSLFKGLAEKTGAGNSNDYRLVGTNYPSAEQICNSPYQRLRIGFTYTELVEFLRTSMKISDTPEENDTSGRRPTRTSTPEAITSALIDTFVDLGAIVPTITFFGEPCLRVYRKGEANPSWDTALERMTLALDALKQKDIKISRTRFSKVAAILAFSSDDNSGLQTAAYPRGTVAIMGKSVVESSDIEVTLYLKKNGLWNKCSETADEQ